MDGIEGYGDTVTTEIQREEGRRKVGGRGWERGEGKGGRAGQKEGVRMKVGRVENGRRRVWRGMERLRCTRGEFYKMTPRIMGELATVGDITKSRHSLPAGVCG